MGKRDAPPRCGKSATKGARSVSLHHQQLHSAEDRLESLGDRRSVRVRIIQPSARQVERAKSGQAMVRRRQRGMLSGEYQFRRQRATPERMDDGSKLDRFGTRADNECYAVMQPSP
jgi:hypothetical protein